ncbi:putative Ig domain-containing protein [archaeon]|nr:putative Ig domain-containing protein [archaeon]
MKKILMLLTMFLLATVLASAQPTLPIIGGVTVNETDLVTIDITLIAGPDDGGATTWWTDLAQLTRVSSNDTFARYTWTTGYDDAGVYTVMFNTSDSDSMDSTTMTLTVNNMNRAPSFSSTAVTSAVVGHAYTYNATATDLDDDSLSYSLTASPAGMLIDGSSGMITWTPSAAGTESVTVQASDGSLTDTQSFDIITVTQSWGLTLSAVTIGGSSQERDQNVTATLTVSNSGSETITGISLSSNANSEYAVGFTPATIASLVAGASTTVTMNGYIPLDKDAALETIGTITATGTSSGNQVTATSVLSMRAENNLEIRDIDISVNDDSENVDDGDTVNLFPASEIEVTIEVKNTHATLDIEDITVTIYNDDLDIDEEDDISKIKDGKKDTLIISFTIDQDADEDKYDVEIIVEGEDEEGAIHGETWNVEFDLEEEGIIITNAELIPESLRCGQDTFDIEVELTNVGTKDEDDAAIEIVADTLDYEKRVANLNIDEDEDITRTYEVSVPATAEPGVHVVEITAFKDFDEQTHVKYLYFTIPSGCSPVIGGGDDGEDGGQGGIVLNPPPVGDGNGGAGDGWVDAGTGQDSTRSINLGTWGTVLLVLANVLIIVIILVLVIKFLTRV